jgi:hypothetical protein
MRRDRVGQQPESGVLRRDDEPPLVRQARLEGVPARRAGGGLRGV